MSNNICEPVYDTSTHGKVHLWHYVKYALCSWSIYLEIQMSVKRYAKTFHIEFHQNLNSSSWQTVNSNLSGIQVSEVSARARGVQGEKGKFSTAMKPFLCICCCMKSLRLGQKNNIYSVTVSAKIDMYLKMAVYSSGCIAKKCIRDKNIHVAFETVIHTYKTLIHNWIRWQMGKYMK
jgi:hypothetical protein